VFGSLRITGSWSPARHGRTAAGAGRDPPGYGTARRAPPYPATRMPPDRPRHRFAAPARHTVRPLRTGEYFRPCPEAPHCLKRRKGHPRALPRHPATSRSRRSPSGHPARPDAPPHPASPPEFSGPPLPRRRFAAPPCHRPRPCPPPRPVGPSRTEISPQVWITRNGDPRVPHHPPHPAVSGLPRSTTGYGHRRPGPRLSLLYQSV